MRMNIEHLNTVSGLVESSDFYSTELLLQGEAIKTVFQTRKDIPKINEEKEYDHFNDTAIFATKLNLILEKLKNPEFTPEAYEEAPAVKSLLQNLPNTIAQLLKQHDTLFSHQQTSVQVELLRKMLLMSEKITNYKQFSQRITHAINTSYKKLCQQLPSSPINLNNCQSHPALLRLKIDIENYQEFISATKRAYATAKNYAERLMLLEHSIYPSWEILKDQLSLNDLEWLEEQVNNLAPEYANLPSRFSKMMGRHAPLANELAQRAKSFKFIISSAGFGLLARLTYLITQQCKDIAENVGRAQFWHTTINNQIESLENTQATLIRTHRLTNELGQHSTNIINTLERIQSELFTLQSLLIDTEKARVNINESAMKCEYGPYNSALVTLGLGAVSASVLSYGAYRYFKAPVEHKPLKLPAWWQPLKVKLEAEQATSALNTRRGRR